MNRSAGVPGARASPTHQEPDRRGLMAIQKQRPPYKVECYLKWLRLRNSKEYREASQEIRQLQDGVRKSDERFSSAQSAYMPYLEQSVPDSIEKRRQPFPVKKRKRARGLA